MQAVLMNRRVIVVGDVNQEDFSEKQQSLHYQNVKNIVGSIISMSIFR